MIFLSGMNALLERFHSFILPFLRGEDRVCQCTCGSHQAHHVVPYRGALSMDSTQNYLRRHIITQQESDMMTGLLLGLCISWLLLWLISVRNWTFSFWWANQLNNALFWSWMPKFSNTRELFRQLLTQHTEEPNRRTPSEISTEPPNT